MAKSNHRQAQLQKKRAQKAARMKGGGESKYAKKVKRGQMYGIQRSIRRGAHDD